MKTSIVINLSGSAGQSLGAFAIKGLKLVVRAMQMTTLEKDCQVEA
jgi:Glutamate synthase domain 3